MTDVGLRLLDCLYEQMMIDDEWAVRRERGFTWWAYRLAQHVEVGPPVWSEDRYICSVRIWTELVRNVDPAADPASVLAALNPSATLSALVWDPADATVNECLTATVHDEIFGWLSKVLATAAVLQNTSAHSRAHAMAEVTGGVAAASDHPSGRHRPDMDDLLNLPERVIAPEGTKPSQFVGSHFQRAEAFLHQMRFVGTVDSGRLSCEVPFSGSTPAMFIEPGGTLQTSFVDMFTDTTHPEAGNGLLCLMKIPYKADPERIAVDANRLNLWESTGEPATFLLGAWCPDQLSETTLAFCAFVPNLLAKYVLIENLLSYMTNRSRRAAAFLSASPQSADAALSGWAVSDSDVHGQSREFTGGDMTGSATPSAAELRHQARELAKSTALASARIAGSAAKLGIARLRKRLSENGRQD